MIPCCYFNVDSSRKRTLRVKVACDNLPQKSDVRLSICVSLTLLSLSLSLPYLHVYIRYIPAYLL
jgi:hypothetical protein